MNKRINSTLYTFCCGLLLALSIPPALSGTAIHYSGDLVAGACELVVNGDIMATVDFHTVSTDSFQATGKTNPIPFQLSLKNCHSALAAGVLVTFTGIQDSRLTNLLALESTSLASGFAIGIQTTDQQPLIINAAQGTPFVLTEGNTTINFQSWLEKYSDEDITPGEFTGSATVEFEYQ